MKKEINNKVLQKIYRLEAFHGTYRTKCRRNLRLYEYSPTMSLDNLTDDAVVGYYQQGYFDIEDDTTSSVQENVIRSCIETLVSKIASQKVRPFINTVNGTFKEMQIAKQAQDFFDAIYEEQNVEKTIADVFKDACIFDRGAIYVDIGDKRISRVMPWQVYVDPRENSYRRLTQAVYKQEQFPITLLPLKIDEERFGNIETVTYYQYWDLNAKKKYHYIPELDSYWEEEEYTQNALPFIFINYSSPIKACSCQSVVDLLYGIQMEIDAIMVKIKDASQLTAIMDYWIPEGSSIKESKLSNRTGSVYTYTATPNMTGSPVTQATHPFMDPQWLTTLETLKEHAYELVGISQLSATSQKPQGLDSGVALKTMTDIESDRFECQLNTVIRSYVDLARLLIQLFPEETDILPPNKYRSTITWADIVSMKDQMTIQFSAASALSKDPSTKLQQLQALYAAGLIPQSHIAKLMQIPDLNDGYNIACNSFNAVQTVIDDCIENDNYSIPDYIPQQMLLEEIMNTCLSLKAANNPKNEADIQKLLKLYDVAINKDINAQTSAEMAATQTISNELMADIQNPNGQFNTMVQQGMTQVDSQTNNLGE